jgi:hypothetical protein
MVTPPLDEATSQKQPASLRVSLTIPASLTAADKAWGLEHPEKVNAALAQWYGHRRQCRRAAQRAKDSLATGITKCRCLA